MMIRTWARIENWLEKNHPELLEALNPPADDSEIHHLESTLHVTLPDSIKESYRIHDGQSDEPTGLIYGTILMPISDILERWDELDCTEEMNEDVDLRTSTPLNCIKQLGFSQRWIPFTDGSGGMTYIGVDLEPGPEGKSGQIITFSLRDYDRFVLADSFEEFMSSFADALESQPFEINELQELSMPDPERPHQAMGIVEYLIRKKYK